MQMDRIGSQSEANIGEEIKDVRPILSSVTDIWNIISMAVTEDQSDLNELGRRKIKPIPKWIAYQLDELEKKAFKTEQENDQEIKCC